ncbi:MAG: signal peptidase I [Clostridia bacterium]|nr:signal peptidase I [Clostridia bacterium]
MKYYGYPPKKFNFFKETYEIFDTVVFSAVIVLVAFTLIFRIFVVSGTSMDPTLKDGDRLVVSNLFYTAENGDIICFYDDFEDEVLVKRVIATAGQTVDIKPDGYVYVDDEKLDEPYLARVKTDIKDFPLPYTVEEGYIFALGDNRPVSLDSRYTEIGPVSTKDLLGKVLFRMMPSFGKVD